MTAAQAQQQRASRVAARRLDEARCAWDFVVHGEEGHEEHCVRPAGLVCSREYDPGPAPEDVQLYKDTGLGTLWGLNETEAWQLAGWNVKRRRA